MEKQKILIIDDDPGTVKTLSDILRIKGYELFTAKNGMEGLDILKQFFVNLAIIDLGLPDMSGLEVLGRVKATNPFIEVIILTGNASLNSAIEAMNRGVFSYLLKPYDMKQLMLNIRHALERQRDQEKIAAQNIELKRINSKLREVNTILEKDTQERKLREKKLRVSMDQIVEAEQEWESLVNSLYDLIFLIDDKGCAIRSNQRATDWGLGQLVDIKGEYLHDILHPYCQKPACYLRDFISKNTKNLVSKQNIELEVEDDILERYLNIRMRPVQNVKKRRKGLRVVVIHDITERRLAEKSLLGAYEKLKETQQELIRIEKLALLGKFSSGIAHEIRNPLANIRASAQFCLNKYEPNEEIKKHLRIMLRNSEQANEIIKNLIDLATPSEDFLKPGNMNDIINRVCDLVRIKCEKQHVLLHKKLSRRLPSILMYEELMEKAFLNIVLNALDAMPKGGKLAISTYPYFDKNEVVIRILDTGKGISKENMDNIFVPFFSTKHTGIGLGLCLADHVISSHKGKIFLNSKEEEGTMVTIKLPISKEIEETKI